jgi:hypothetical protein
MEYQPDQVHETMSLIVADHAEMVSTLATTLAIESDEFLQAQLRKLAGASDGQSFMVSQLQSRAWLKVGNDRGIIVHRDLDLALGSNPGLTNALQRTLSPTALATARELLDPVWEMDAIPSRKQYTVLRQWSSLLEQLAYKSGARLSILLDLLRPEIRENLTVDAENASPQLHLYWSALHVMANLILLASDAECRLWLNEMASRLSWTMWTPTFPLLPPEPTRSGW